MGGRPEQFQVTNLNVLKTGASFGVPDDVMDVVATKTSGGGADSFDLLVEFEWSPLSDGDWASWEGASDNSGPFYADAYFYAESIGPGPDLDIGTNNVALKYGGDKSINTDASKSVYQVRLAIADANAVFQDAGVLAPGLYRIGCAVNFSTPYAPFKYYDAFWQQDLVIRVVEQPT